MTRNLMLNVSWKKRPDLHRSDFTKQFLNKKKTESKFIELSKNKIDAAVNNQKFPGKEKYNRKAAKS